jgi:hypothetical protein
MRWVLVQTTYVRNDVKSRHSFLIHSVACLTTSPQPLPKWVLQRLRTSASSFQFPVSCRFLKVIQ